MSIIKRLITIARSESGALFAKNNESTYSDLYDYLFSEPEEQVVDVEYVSIQGQTSNTNKELKSDKDLNYNYNNIRDIEFD
jgi:hypothetical protein